MLVGTLSKKYDTKMGWLIGFKNNKDRASNSTLFFTVVWWIKNVNGNHQKLILHYGILRDPLIQEYRQVYCNKTIAEMSGKGCEVG